jgi:hypothetical protein
MPQYHPQTTRSLGSMGPAALDGECASDSASLQPLGMLSSLTRSMIWRSCRTGSLARRATGRRDSGRYVLHDFLFSILSLTCPQDDGEEVNDEQSSEESGGEDTNDSCSEEGEDGGYDDGSDTEMREIYER